MVQITLPDGSQRDYPGPVSVAEVAASIGAGLAKAALAGQVDGQVVDTSYVIAKPAQLSIITAKDVQGLEVIRHSTAHLLAYAVKTLFPQAQVTIGPVIEHGFFYDFSYSRAFTPEDLEAIEKKMTQLAQLDEPVVRRVLPRDEAVAYFKGLGEHYKADIIASIPANEDVSLYREGAFEDLCRGPHVPSTGKLKHFKLMKVAGAYWRGDHRNEMLQRIYGTAWASKEDLQQHLTMLEEAEKRDHRKLGRELDLFHIDEHSPGTVFWHPKGWVLWQEVEQYMRRVYRDNGYQEVKAPQILDQSLWEKTGHWDKYRENMFVTESEKRDFALKPMNCPGHIIIFNQGIKSYRDLPLRFGEFGQCHRNEPSGGLHGIMRVRAFTQDDGHIFCTEAQIQSEVIAFTTLLQKVYKDFGFTDIIYKLSTRPEKRIGSEESWDRAENALAEGLRASGCDFAATDGKDIGADIDLVDMATGGAVTGAPWMGSSIRVAVGSTRAVAYYTAPSGAACEVKLYTNFARTTLAADTDSAPEQIDSRTGSITAGTSRQFVLGTAAALTASSQYYLRVACGSQVAVVPFATRAAGSDTVATVAYGSATTGEYSANADMSSPTAISSSATHTIPIPAGTVRYYRRTGGPIQVFVAP
jgi:threonyl-tRNA synthetase